MAGADEARLRQLLVRGLGGDGAAHKAFLTETATVLRAYFRNRLRAAPEDCEDLVQETLIAIHTRRHTYDPSAPFTPWMYAIARYRLIDHVRGMRRRGIAAPIEAADGAWVSESAFHSGHIRAQTSAQDAADARRDVAALLAQLPEKQRTAIRLTRLEHRSVREAAQITGWSESDIKVSAHRGLKALASLMRAQASR